MATINNAIMITPHTRPCWVDGRRAIFHRWTDSARPVKPRGMEDDETAEHFQLHSIHALVEYEDGTVERVWPNTVHFADSRELFNGLAWEQMEACRDALPYEHSEEVAAAAEKAVSRNCLTCGAPTHACSLDCKACPPGICRCRDCVDNNLWIPKGGTA